MKSGFEIHKKCKEGGLDCFSTIRWNLRPQHILKPEELGLKHINRELSIIVESGLDSIGLVSNRCERNHDKEIGNILQYAIDNCDVVSGIIFQPVSLCGRITGEEIRKFRINNSDVLAEIEKQTNGVLKLEKDWYPLTTVVEFGRILSWLNDAPPVEFTCHPDCGFATYMVLNPETNQMESLLDYVQAFEALDFANTFWNKYKHRSKGFLPTLNISTENNEFLKTFDKAISFVDKQQLKFRFILGMLPYIKKSGKFMEIFARLLVNPKWDTISSLTYGSLLIGSMHFQDSYNFNIERVKRCIVHYGVPMPDGTVREIPFCAHNNFHREKIEAEIAKPYEGIKKEDWAKNVEGNEFTEKKSDKPASKAGDSPNSSRKRPT